MIQNIICGVKIHRKNMAQDLINDIANACQKKEGWFAGSVSQRCNNPGNILDGSLAKDIIFSIAEITRL